MSLTETKATQASIAGRKQLFEQFDQIYKTESIDKVDLFQNLGLFTRSSLFTKFLFLNELYEIIVNVPGIITEFGVHLGQNLVLFENLRAIYEPWNQNRRIIGFDTFFREGGYASRSPVDGQSHEITSDGYRLPNSYVDTLNAILAFHEGEHVLSHIRKTQVVVGDVVETVPKFLDENPGDVVSLAYFDLATYKPTLACLNSVLPHLVPGSVLLMDELNFKSYPGASIAFKEFVSARRVDYEVRTSRFMRDRAIVIYKGLR